MCLAPYRSPVSRLRRHLHWLPVQERITFKIAMLTHKVLTHHQPGYFPELIVKHRLVYNLRSADNNLLVIPGRKLRVPPPLSESLRRPNGTVFHFIAMHNNHFQLHSQLKTYLFGSMYGWSSTFERQTTPLTHWTSERSGIRFSKGLWTTAATAPCNINFID